jgi:hypothetical protein
VNPSRHLIARRANHFHIFHHQTVQTLRQKYSLNPSGKSPLRLRASHPMRGALRNVTNARWDAVDAAAMQDELGLLRTAKWCGPGAPVLALSSREVSRWQQAGHRGELEGNRKTIAQGKPDCLRWTCMLVCVFFRTDCTRDRGCSAHPAFPAPSSLARAEGDASLGRITPRECERVSFPPSSRPTPGPIAPGSGFAEDVCYSALIERSRGMAPGLRRDDERR